MLTCWNCGRPVQPDDRFCNNCGAAMTYRAPTEPYQASKSSDNGMKILVIVIIVVLVLPIILSGVLYIMVMGFGESTLLTPTGTIQNVVKLDERTLQLTFGPFDKEVHYMDCMFTIMADNNLDINQIFPVGGPIVYHMGETTYQVTFTDIDLDSIIDTGDYITIIFPTSLPNTMSFSLLYIPTGAQIVATNWAND